MKIPKRIPYSSTNIKIELDRYYQEHERDLSKFYNDCHYRRGTLSDLNITAIEYIAEYVMNNWVAVDNDRPFLNFVGEDNRPEYCDKLREEEPKGDNEELFQRDLYFGRRQLPNELKTMLEGEEFIWFELSPGPGIKGGIDLISINRSLNRLSIYELKFGFAKEHILKAILEIQTYFQRTNFHKFKEDWNKNKHNCAKPIETIGELDFDEHNVRKVILIDKRIRYFDESEYESIKSMINRFDIQTMYFDGGLL